VESGRQVIVGVNEFVSGAERRLETLRVDPEIGRRQVERVQRLRAGRDHEAAAGTIRGLKVAASGRDNVMLPILECVRAYCTLGEICGALREVFGEYEPATLF